jgi:uncharacterized membrane protein
MAFGVLMGLGLAFVAFVLPFIALSKANSAKQDIEILRRDFDEWRQRSGIAPGTEADVAPVAEPTPAVEPIDTSTSEIAPEQPPEPEAIVAEPVLDSAMGADETAVDDSPPEAAAAPRLSMEERLTSRWFVWLGGVALALGGVFLVKYSLDMGLLGPRARLAFGIALGLALIVVSEVLRQRPRQRAIAETHKDYVPAALSAAGIAILYASVYVGYLFYDLYPPLVAFVALAAVSILAIGLALLQGPFIAALGLVGGYATPMLVASNEPNAIGLFAYLAIVTVAGVGILRYRGWVWLLWLTIAGSTLWVALWYGLAYAPGDAPVVGIYILALMALFTFFRPRFLGVPGQDAPFSLEWRLDLMPMPERAVAVGYGALVALGFVLVTSDHFRNAGVGAFAVIAAATIFLGRREQIFAAVPRLAGIAAVALIMVWDLPRELAATPVFFRPEGEPLLPFELVSIAVAAGIWAAIFAIGGFIALWGAARPGHWAAVSAATPVAILVMLHARLNGFETNLAWAPVAIVLAVLSLAAAARCARYRDAPGINGALGAYCVGVIAAMSLAFAMVVDNAWLTVALALQIPGIAYVDSKLDIKALRHTALVAAVVVILRLLANPEVFHYAIAPERFGLTWILYGYGIPAVCFYLAKRVFASRASGLLLAILEAGAIAFSVMLVSLEIRHLIAEDGRITGYYSSLLEYSLQTLTWLSAAYALYRRDGPEASPVITWGWRVLAGFALFHIVAMEIVIYNPWSAYAEVGARPILNTLLLAFAAPALILIGFFRIARARGHGLIARIAGISALALIFLWLTLEVRHAFHGSQLGIGETTNAELYVYSAAWLIYGAALLALGLWRRTAALRHASLAIILLTIAKVFLYDMSLLTGLYRVLSFLGLGLALVAIGFLYQRFVFPIAKAKPEESN